jgi:hypothetical protein
MITKQLSKPLVLTALLALSLSNLPPAHADGFVSKVKGAFVATGDALKDTARATGNVIAGSARMTGGVIKESAIVTGDVLKGTAKAGEAACVATGDVLKGTAKAGEAACVATGDVIKNSAKATGTACVATGRAVGTTAGAVAGATGEAIGGSARAVGAKAATVAGATEGALGMRNKSAAPAAITASNPPLLENKPYSPVNEPPVKASNDQPKEMPARVKVEKAKGEKVKPEKIASVTQAEPPAPLSLSTEGTRISPPMEESNESPSWNVQEPVARSTAFASQYALRTTPLPVTNN